MPKRAAPKLIALVGATASGKSDLALGIARRLGACIFSLDSLSIYQEIDIASAKPTRAATAGVRHFALDILRPCDKVNAGVFLALLDKAIEACKGSNQNLLIVGGSSFYLRSIMRGLSPAPVGSPESTHRLKALLATPLPQQYGLLQKIDSVYASRISPGDTYRVSKALEIFILSGQPPSMFFANNPPKPPAITPRCYNLLLKKSVLHKRIESRTASLLRLGIIDEAERLASRYGTDIQPFKSVGLRECLQFLRGEISLEELENLINIHTKQLAKRQVTFNKTQIDSVKEGDSKTIEASIMAALGG